MFWWLYRSLESEPIQCEKILRDLSLVWWIWSRLQITWRFLGCWRRSGLYQQTPRELNYLFVARLTVAEDRAWIGQFPRIWKKAQLSKQPHLCTTKVVWERCRRTEACGSSRMKGNFLFGSRGSQISGRRGDKTMLAKLLGVEKSGQNAGQWEWRVTFSEAKICRKLNLCEFPNCVGKTLKTQ